MKKNSLILLAFSYGLLSCGTFTFNDTKGAQLIASMENEKLYMRDIVGLNVPNLTTEDSVEIIKSYADYWLRAQAVVNYSQERYSSKEDEIEKLLEEYKRSLFQEFFEKEYTKGVSDYVSDEEIDNYYNTNKQKFILSSNMVKAQVMTMPKAYKDATLLKKKFASSNRDDFEDILSIAERDNLVVKDFSQNWVYFSDILTNVPLTSDIKQFSISKGIFEESDENFKYTMKIIDYRLVGDVTPKEMIVDLIKRAIVIERRKSKVEEIRDSIYNVAVVNGSAVIKYE